MNCEICFDEVDDKNKLIHCPYCNKGICLNCAKEWLLQETVAYSCFNIECKKPWNFTFIFNNFPLDFINNELKIKYANICFELDKQYHLETFIDNYNTIYKAYNIIKELIDEFIKNNFDDNIFKFFNDNYELIKLKYKFFNDPIGLVKKCYNEYKDEINNELDLKLHKEFNTSYDYNNILVDTKFYNEIFKESEYYLNNSYEVSLYFITNYALYKYNVKNVDNKLIRQIIKKIYDFLYNVIYEIHNYYDFCECFKAYYIIYFMKKNNKSNYHKIYDLILDINDDKLYKLSDYKIIHELITKNVSWLSNNIINEKQDNKSIIKKVSKCLNEECLGYLYKYDKELICNICNKIYCKKCHKEINPEFIEYVENNEIKLRKNNKYNEKIDSHKCNKEDIETVKLLTENVKNCPKCEVPIFKTDGCDHMWCPECHTMFNWSDLKITKTTTNPLYFEWLRSQGITPQRYNHPDAQPYIHDCERQLNFNDCMSIISKYNFKNKEKLINFVSNIELKIKPLNDGKLNMYRIKYVFKLIDENKYKKFITTQYLSKFFIECYNNIIVNTVYMISNLYHQINNDIEQYDNNKINQKYNKSIKLIKINEDNYINQIKEIINIHNNGINELYKLNPSIVIENINIDTFNIEKYNSKPKKTNKKNNKKEKEEEQKQNQEIINYINSPLTNIKDNLNDYMFIYKLFYRYETTNISGFVYDDYKNIYFMKLNILQNQSFYNLLFSDELKNILCKDDKFNWRAFDRKIIKSLMQTYDIPSKRNNKLVIYIIEDLLQSFNSKIYGKKEQFDYLKNIYNELINILNDENYINNYNDYIERINLDNINKLYKYIRKIYKKDKSKLINEFTKINFNYEKLNNILFNIHYDDKLYMMLFEDKIYNILNKLTN